MEGIKASASAPRPLILARQPVPTRDRVSLVTDVYLPTTTDPAPVVLVRTPYGRTLPFLLLLAQRMSRAGHCVLIQDSRGRYQSQGSFDWGREVEDTHDTLLWVRDQEWSNGRVALLGLSFSAHANFAAAVEGLPEGLELSTIVSVMGAVDYHSLFFRGGAMILHWALPWVTILSGTRGTFSSQGLAGRPWQELFRHLPLADLPEDWGVDRTLWRLITSNPAYGGGWRDLDLRQRLAGITVPTLHLSGWFDFMLSQTIDGFVGVRQGDETEGGGSQRGPHRLIVGDWDHRSIFYPFKAAPQMEAGGETSVQQLVVEWLDRWSPQPSQPARAGAGDERSGALLFVLEADRWIEASTFPPDDVVVRDWYLASAPHTPARADGRLVAEAPKRSGQDHFVFDPAAPVPTVGGAVWPFPAIGLTAGSVDQSEVEERSDVLIYDSEPLSEDVEVVGYCRLELWASTSGRDTDFTAKLVDLRPSGEALLVQDGILRGRFRESLETTKLLDPNRPYLFTIELGPIAYRFRRNHRLRLEVSSSNFPKYDRNTNAGAPLFTTAASMVAQQVVFTGPPTLSRLRLPILSAAPDR